MFLVQKPHKEQKNVSGSKAIDSRIFIYTGCFRPRQRKDLHLSYEAIDNLVRKLKPFFPNIRCPFSETPPPESNRNIKASYPPPQGRPFRNWLGGPCPRIFQLLGGGGKIAPQISNIGGKVLKIPTYLVLKGQKKFSTPFKTLSLDVS